jgi:hypothetical protein
LGLTKDVKAKLRVDVDFVGRGQWKISVGSRHFLTVGPHSVMLASDNDHTSRVAAAFKREFGKAFGRRSCLMLKAVLKSGHGALLAFVQAAEEEAHLHRSSTTIPLSGVELAPEYAASLCAIDGALLLDDSGRCFAAGVILSSEILNGINTPSPAQPERGARFNAGRRYRDALAGKGRRVLTLVISDDGYVDIFTGSDVRSGTLASV